MFCEISYGQQQRASSLATVSLPNASYLKQIVSSWCDGEGALPLRMGLISTDFKSLSAFYFPARDLPDDPLYLGETEAERLTERDDLKQLLLDHRAGRHASERWLAAIIAAGCLGYDHLWEDLGLASREQLSAMLMNNFPQLAIKNDRNMKWKKFLYKQLCNQKGIYTCRAPRCEVCSDYSSCFGPES